MSEILLEQTTFTRSPESEIYGRSLSTIRRLGGFMVGRTLSEITSSPEADQARVEFYTSVEEGFGTDMELGGGLEVRDFDTRPVINGYVMAKDLKTAVSSMTDAGFKCAMKKYDVEKQQEDHRFSPQVTRSYWDHENALLVDEMVQGKTTYNTRIVISPFPEEAAAQSGNEYWRDIGYVPHLRRGFVQLYHTTKEGQVLTGSLSFDGSSKQRLREVLGAYGIEIPEDEVTDNWLKYAFTGNFDNEQAKALAMTIADQSASSRSGKTTNTVNMTQEYGSLMNQAFDESYIHICESLARGRQTQGVTGIIHQLAGKAHNFNQRYSAALYKMRANQDRFTDDDSIVLHELIVYSTIEMMRALHLKKTETSQIYTSAHYDNLARGNLQHIAPSSFQDILSSFGAEGARNNRTYSACGLSISAGGEKSEYGPQTVFGGKFEDDSHIGDDKYGSLSFKCPKGHANTRPRNKLIEKCKTCGTSVKC